MSIARRQSPSPGGKKLLIASLVLMLIGTALVIYGQLRISRKPEPSPQNGQIADSTTGQIEKPAQSSDEEHEPTIEEEIDAALLAQAQLRKSDNTFTAESATRDAEDLRGQYAAAYRKAREKKLEMNPRCEACNKTQKQLALRGAHLETHHVISVLRIFTEDRDPELVGKVSNLIVLCRNGQYNCHFTIGHDPDGPDGPLKPNWKESNRYVRRDAAKRLATLAP